MAEMIDAYTIGITLALEDGVSDGITAIRRELAELDVAVAESATRLLMLRKLAADLVIPMPRDRVTSQAALFAPPTFRPEAVVSPLAAADIPAAVPAIALPLASVAVSTAQTAMPTRQIPGVGPRAFAASRATESASAKPAASPPTVSVAPAPTAPSPAMRPVAQPSSTAPTPVLASAAPLAQPAAQQPVPPPLGPKAKPDKSIDFASIARSIAPPVPALRPQRADRPTSKPSETAPRPAIIVPATPLSPQTIVQPPPKASAPAALFASRRPSPRSPTPQYSVSHDQEVPASTAVSPPVPMHPAPAFSIAPSAEHLPASDPRSTEHAPTPSGAVSSERPQTDGPAYAELHLDGVAIGRWVTRHLERQVTRPQAGATGFDPRMSPTWAGAPIGN